MADHNKPVATDGYANWPTLLKARHDDLAKGLDPAKTSPTNLPADAIRWTSAGKRWERWTGSAWVELEALYAISISGNAASATALATARTINGTSFNGSGNITTTQWGAARTLTIGGTGKSVNGGSNVAWTLAEIGAPAVDGTGATGSWPISITGNAPTADSATNCSRQVVAGNGLTGGGALTANRTVTLGTPGAITPTSMNSVGTSTHSHALDPGTYAIDISGTAANATSAGSATTAANCSRQVVAGNGLSGGGALTADRTVTLGTPGTITGTSTNSVTATSHTHEAANASTTARGMIEIATSEETASLSDLTRAIVPGYLEAGVKAVLNAGGAAPVYGARTWVNFDGTGTPSIRDSGNVSSITDHGTGQYSANFATAMPDVNYCPLISANASITLIVSMSTTSLRVGTSSSSGSNFDPTIVSVAIIK